MSKIARLHPVRPKIRQTAVPRQSRGIMLAPVEIGAVEYGLFELPVLDPLGRLARLSSSRRDGCCLGGGRLGEGEAEEEE